MIILFYYVSRSGFIPCLPFSDWSISFSLPFSGLIHVIACVKFPSFLRLNNHSTVCTHRVWLMHSSFSGRSGCFHLLATGSHVATNVMRKYLPRTLFLILLGITLGVELLDHGCECL